MTLEHYAVLRGFLGLPDVLTHMPGSSSGNMIVDDGLLTGVSYKIRCRWRWLNGVPGRGETLEPCQCASEPAWIKISWKYPVSLTTTLPEEKPHPWSSCYRKRMNHVLISTCRHPSVTNSINMKRWKKILIKISQQQSRPIFFGSELWFSMPPVAWFFWRIFSHWFVFVLLYL